MMYVLNAEKRDAKAKVKQIRRQGLVPGCLYGGKLEETMLLQFTDKEAAKLLREKTVGGQVSIQVNGQKLIALLKEIDSGYMGNRIDHLSFQSLIADEPVTSTARIFLQNEDSVSDVVRQTLFEISIRALPANLLEEIYVDMTGMAAGDALRLEDLDIAKDEDVEVLTALDTMVVNVLDRDAIKLDLGEEEEETEETEAMEEGEAGEETEEAAEEEA